MYCSRAFKYGIILSRIAALIVDSCEETIQIFQKKTTDGDEPNQKELNGYVDALLDAEVFRLDEEFFILKVCEFWRIETLKSGNVPHFDTVYRLLTIFIYKQTELPPSTGENVRPIIYTQIKCSRLLEDFRRLFWLIIKRLKAIRNRREDLERWVYRGTTKNKFFRTKKQLKRTKNN